MKNYMKEILEEYADDLLKMKEKLSSTYWQDANNVSAETKVKLEDIVIHLDLARDLCNSLTSF